MRITKGTKMAALALFILLSMGLLLSSGPPYVAPSEPVFLQAAFMRDDFKCFYMLAFPGEQAGEPAFGDPAPINKWVNYSRDLTKSDVHYDELDGIYNDLTTLKIKACTPGNGEEITLYIDNVKMIDSYTGDVLTVWDFEDGDAHGPKNVQGTSKADNLTVAEFDGNKALLVHGTTKSLYGNNGLETSWKLPACPNAAKGDKWTVKGYGKNKTKYTLSFDYYFAVAK